MATNGVEAIVGGVQIAQLHKIQATLNTVKTLATVGAIASVASLGVSIAGFAAVLTKLSRMEGKLDEALGQAGRVRGLVERLHVKADVLPIAVLRARLEELSMASLYEEPRRSDSLRDSVERLAELRHYYGALLESEEFCSFATDNLLALLDTHERLVAVCEGELFAEFLLGASYPVIKRRFEHQRSVFDAVAWQGPESLYQLTQQGDRDAGVYLVTSAEVRRERVKAVSDIRSESLLRLASLPMLAKFLEQRSVETKDYFELIKKLESSRSPLVILDARGDRPKF